MTAAAVLDDLPPRPWVWLPCAVGCPDPILALPGCERAWHHACALAAIVVRPSADGPDAEDPRPLRR